MIIKGKVNGYSVPVNVGKEKQTLMQILGVSIPYKDYTGTYTLNVRIFGEKCGSFSVGEEVLCEVDRYNTQILSVNRVSDLY